MNLFTVSAEVQLDTKSFNAQADEAVQKGKQMSEEPEKLHIYNVLYAGKIVNRNFYAKF